MFNVIEGLAFPQSNSTWMGERPKYTRIEEKVTRKEESDFRSISNAYQCLSAQFVCNAIVKYIGVLACWIVVAHIVSSEFDPSSLHQLSNERTRKFRVPVSCHLSIHNSSSVAPTLNFSSIVVS
jgi:hypothetical protein